MNEKRTDADFGHLAYFRRQVNRFCLAVTVAGRVTTESASAKFNLPFARKIPFRKANAPNLGEVISYLLLRHRRRQS